MTKREFIPVSDLGNGVQMGFDAEPGSSYAFIGTQKRRQGMYNREDRELTEDVAPVDQRHVSEKHRDILLQIAETMEGRKFVKMTSREEKIYHILEGAGFLCIDGPRVGIPDDI